MSNAQYHRYRITFAKSNSLRFTGHLDLHRALERTFRRAGIPLAYTQGFNPRPRINLGSALPLGYTSDCELADIRIETELPTEELRKDLLTASPPGLIVKTVEKVDASEPSLQTQLVAAMYQVQVESALPIEALQACVDALLNAENLHRRRRGKEYDLRPLIETLEISNWENGKAWLVIRLAAREGATGRPDEVLLALELDPTHARFHRERLILLDKPQD